MGRSRLLTTFWWLVGMVIGTWLVLRLRGHAMRVFAFSPGAGYLLALAAFVGAFVAERWDARRLEARARTRTSWVIGVREVAVLLCVVWLCSSIFAAVAYHDIAGDREAIRAFIRDPDRLEDWLPEMRRWLESDRRLRAQEPVQPLAERHVP
jgi:hypothetical protein